MFGLRMQLLQTLQLFFHELIVSRGLAFCDRLYHFLHRFLTGFLGGFLSLLNCGFDEECFQLFKSPFDLNQGKHLNYPRLLIESQ